MKILLASHLFSPSVGGIEQVSEIVASQLARLGHEVVVVTQTAEPTEHEAPFAVKRRPGLKDLLKLLRWCDVYLQSNLSLATLWPAMILRKPTMVVHHTWISRPDGSFGWRDRLKLCVTRYVPANFAVSNQLAASIHCKCRVIPNPYRDDLFVARADVAVERDLVFVGRLVSSKGGDTLIDALALLARDGKRPTLTIVGCGPEEELLRARIRDAGLETSVEFRGAMSGEPLGRLLNQHRVLVVPSRWNEPFGLVALEGIASGCAVIASSGGGLPAAAGPCGVFFPNGDAVALAARIAELIDAPVRLAELQSGATEHLKRHRQNAVAEFYERELSALLS